MALVLDNHAEGNPDSHFRHAESEMLLADLALLEKRRERLRKESRLADPEGVAVKKALNALEGEVSLRRASLSRQEKDLLAPFALVSLKPMMPVCNRSGDGVSPEEPARSAAENADAPFLAVDAGLDWNCWRFLRRRGWTS